MTFPRKRLVDFRLLAKIGQIAFDFGKFWFKGQRIGTGQCNVKAHGVVGRYDRKFEDSKPGR